MNPPPNREVVIFSAALELPAGQRGAYLHEACADDPALRLHIEDLLRVHEQAGAFMETEAQPAPNEAGEQGATISMTIAPSEKPGDRIGRYKLLQQIGEGGCGVVYMAEQEEPVRRRVALKVIKLGMDTRQVIARFEAERQALALMDHPNIAKVFDAGATETGRPYFVMELVKGIPITRYCDENNLSTVVRLGLFVQVCQAIQHAHQKGIIHRDIKPSNVLVADHDGVPVPKIIDFGIAKATTDQRLTDKTLFTAFEQFIGTPAYMSPEQAKLSGLDIDTRSDIYSLGVLLYELLTGQTPFEAKRLLEEGLDEVRRIIREEEPVRPSTRLHTLDAAEQTTVAKHRQSDPPKLVHLIRGDLDWIVMKALEKDRARRYETANGLAMDIRRHLADEPVTAGPPSAGYKFRKFARRNRVALAVAAIIAAVLVIATGISVRQTVRATKAEALAKQRLTQVLAASRTAYGPGHSEWFNYLDYLDYLAMLSERSNQWDAAIKLREQLLALPFPPEGLVPKHHGSSMAMDNLVSDYCWAGRGREAIALLEKACELDPKDTIASLRLATWQAWFGQDTDYDATRLRLVQQAEGTDQASTAERAAKAYCLRSSTDADLLMRVLNLAQRAVDIGQSDSNLPWYQLGLGLAEYRNGQFAAAERALTVAEQTVGTNNPDIQGIARLFRAMSLFRQHRPEAARRLFIREEAHMSPPPKDESKPLVDGIPASHDVLIWWLAYKEAKSVLNEPTAAKP